MLAPTDPPVKSGPEDGAIAPRDPRLKLFIRLIVSIDARDPAGMKAAARNLRPLGLSVCIIAPKPSEPPASRRRGAGEADR